MITFTQKGDFENLTTLLLKADKTFKTSDLNRYGREGVEALRHYTPKDTGLTASSWYYKIYKGKDVIKISFYNSNVQTGIPIAVLLQYGHATRNGGFVQGRDYINPAIRPIFDRIARDAWKEVTGK